MSFPRGGLLRTGLFRCFFCRQKSCPPSWRQHFRTSATAQRQTVKESPLEEPFDFGDVVGAAIGWEGVEEGGAVAGGADARVEEHEDAAVGERANEAAEALLEGDDGLRDLEVVEGVAAGGGDGIGACLHDGVGRDGEREFVDDDAGELLALHVYALPEGARAEEDGVGGFAELLQKEMTWGGALQEQRV